MAQNKSRREAKSAESRSEAASARTDALAAVIPPVPAPLLAQYAELPTAEHVADAFVAHYRASLAREAVERSRPPQPARSASPSARPSSAPVRADLLAVVESLRSDAPLASSSSFDVAVSAYASDLASEGASAASPLTEDPFGEDTAASGESQSAFGDENGLFDAPSTLDATPENAPAPAPVAELEVVPAATPEPDADVVAVTEASAEPEAAVEAPAEPIAAPVAAEPKSRRSKNKRPR